MRILLTILLLTLLGGSVMLNAQEPLKGSLDNKRPVLIYDINSKEVSQLLDKQRLGDCTFASGISHEQCDAIKSLKIIYQKQVNELTNLINEKSAQLRTLECQDKPSLKKINKVIDQRAKLGVKRSKLEAECKQKIRALLTNSQRVEFDSKP